MPSLFDIDSAITTDMDSISYTAGEEPWQKKLDAFNIDKQETEASTYQSDWVTWHGFYRNIPEYASSVDTYSKWIVGRKLIYGDGVEEKVRTIRGNKKDDFRKILLNLKRTSKI